MLGSFIFRKKHFIFHNCYFSNVYLLLFQNMGKKEAPDSSPKAQRPAWLLTLKQEQKLKWSISIFL
ncbi:MAG: hypothetical protein ACJAT4_003067 [Granulosicoccus sp.]|jgi:hypothetical protein